MDNAPAPERVMKDSIYKFIVRSGGTTQEFRSVKEAFDHKGRTDTVEILCQGKYFPVIKP